MVILRVELQILFLVVHIVERKQIYTQMNSLVYLQIESGR